MAFQIFDETRKNWQKGGATWHHWKGDTWNSYRSYSTNVAGIVATKLTGCTVTFGIVQ